jgi:hypothetical protein
LFEVRSGRETRVVRLTFDGPPDEIAVPRAHPDLTLVGSEGDDAICLEADGTLVVVGLVTKHRHVLRALAPMPCAVAVTPEHVVWCSAPAASRPGEVWRWWRDTDRVERLGTHGDPLPHLAIRPVPLPYPPERLATDVAIAADRRLGLIDVEGLEWLADVDDTVRHLACTSGALIYATDDWLHHYDLSTEECARIFHLEVLPESLAATEDRVVVAHDRHPNYSLVEARVLWIALDPPRSPSPWPLRAPNTLRAGMDVACGPHGALLVERTSEFGDIDRVTYLPYHWTPFESLTEHLTIHRWLPDGRGGEVLIERDHWCCGPASGELPPGVTARVNEWLRAVDLSGQSRAPITRGWQVSIGANVFFCAHADYWLQDAVTMGKLVRTLAPHIPPLAVLEKL